MKQFFTPMTELSAAGAEFLVEAAKKKADEMGVPECIAVVGPGGDLLAFLKMDGAKPMSIDTAQAKAVTAARTRSDSGSLPGHVGLSVAMATKGAFTELRGGRVIRIDGDVVGAIGVGSGTPDQDELVADAAISALLGQR